MKFRILFFVLLFILIGYLMGCAPIMISPNDNGRFEDEYQRAHPIPNTPPIYIPRS